MDGEKEEQKEEKKEQKNSELRYRMFRMVSVGVTDEPLNQAYDVVSTVALVINMAVMIMNTFDNLAEKYGDLFFYVLLKR